MLARIFTFRWIEWKSKEDRSREEPAIEERKGTDNIDEQDYSS